MEELKLVDLDARFSELALRVKRSGQAIRVVDGNECVVEIIPGHTPKLTKEQAIQELSTLARTLPQATHAEIREAIEFGRR